MGNCLGKSCFKRNNDEDKAPPFRRMRGADAAHVVANSNQSTLHVNQYVSQISIPDIYNRDGGFFAQRVTTAPVGHSGEGGMGMADNRTPNGYPLVHGVDLYERRDRTTLEIFYNNRSGSFRPGLARNSIGPRRLSLPATYLDRARRRYMQRNEELRKYYELERVRYTDDMEKEDDDDCHICLEPRVSGQMIIILPCGHKYHLDCAKKFSRMTHKCPTCRSEF